MLETFRKLWKIKDLQKKVLYTFLMLLIYRLVGVIPAPGIDVSRLNESNNFMQLPLLNMMQMMTGNAFGQMTIMAMGITPYINASIIMQLLAVAFPSLQRMQEEEGGQEKMARITRYVTVGLAVFQAIGLSRAGGYVRSGWYNTVLVGLSMAGGSALAMWIGERITENGIGNGVSIIITANIIERLPQSLMALFEMMNSGFSASGTRFRLVHLLLLFVIFAAVTALTVLLTQGQRRVPIQMAKRIVGNKMSGGTTYMPLKVNFPGVMPIIFAGAILIFPPVLFQMIPNETVRSFAVYFQHDSYSYMTIYGLLILAFSYFWVANMFNPVQISDNLKKEGAYIPGIRPGKPTADFLDSTMTKVTFAGAIFLTALAVFPMLLTKWLKIPYQIASFFGGTSLLIIVGVTIDTLSQMESHLVMRNYDGFLQRGRIKSRRG